MPVAATLAGVAIHSLELPAIEKIAESKGDAFQVLVWTMLSAQTKDAATLAASTRLFAVATASASLAKLATSESRS